ncbi:MAG: hypothetical protein KGL53_08425, partial [Elusimicrobia bacterium]|nr:hypothetical protein [Elusimicrobiota bacterium]
REVVRGASSDPRKGYHWKNWRDRFEILRRRRGQHWADAEYCDWVLEFQIDALTKAIARHVAAGWGIPRELISGLREVVEKDCRGKSLGLAVAGALGRVTFRHRLLGYPGRRMRRLVRGRPA